MKKFSAQKAMGLLFIFSSLLPWLGFGMLAIDSQPWPMIFGIFFIAISKGAKVPISYFGLFVAAFLGILISTSLTEDTYSFLTARSIYNFLSVPVILVAASMFFIRYGIPVRLILMINVLWILVGFLEIFRPEIVELLAPRRTTSDRGVTSLAPEPTFFALQLFFLNWLILKSAEFQFKWPVVIITLINALSVVFLAKSTMGIIYILFASLFVVGWRFKWLVAKFPLLVFLVLLAILAEALFLDGLLLGSRVSALATIFANYYAEYGIFASIELIRFDASINERMEHVVFSIHGSIQNFLVPHGFDSFSENRDMLAKSYSDLFWYSAGSDKVMSWVGDWLYHLGVFGLLSLILAYRSLAARDNGSMIEAVFLFFCLLGAVPLGMATISVLFAAIRFKNRGSTYIAVVGHAREKPVLA